MPVKECQENGKPGYKYGDSGKCYTYTPNDAIERNKAKRQAIIQGIAIGEYAEIGERGGIKKVIKPQNQIHQIPIQKVKELLKVQHQQQEVLK